MKTREKGITRKAPRRAPRRAAHSRRAAELEKLYRELGFVYSGGSSLIQCHDIDRGIAPVDFRPRVDLSFSAVSAK